MKKNSSRVSIIIQGEGKGHFSQALEYSRRIQESGGEIASIYVGKSLFRKLPGYFYTSFDKAVRCFYSPNFIRTNSKKGIVIWLSLLLNFLIAPLYVFEICRLGMMLLADRSKKIYDFYEPVGALAAMAFRNRAERITISHHFYLMHPDFVHPYGNAGSYFWLNFMNRRMYKASTRVYALSYRKGKKYRKIEVIPPIIDQQVREMSYTQGKRDLCYFLNPGFVDEILEYYRRNLDLAADIYTDYLPSNVPANVSIFEPSRENFIQKMANCKRIITTAGFDLVAEAFYLGIPIFLIPSENHYEQYCNALDASRTGMAFQLEELEVPNVPITCGVELEEVEFEPVSNAKFKEFVDKAVL